MFDLLVPLALHSELAESTAEKHEPGVEIAMEDRRRGLPPRFLDGFKAGLLAPIHRRVLDDRSLCLEIRRDYVNIYYRGGSLLKLSEAAGGGYEAFFDLKYARLKRNPSFRLQLPPPQIRQASDVDAWLDQVPNLKLAMDLWLGENRKEEREIQQIIVRDNNFGPMARQTDYYLCDIEYANPNGRFDMVAVHWPSTSPDRKTAWNRRLVLVEVKQGDGALDGDSGLYDHIDKLNAYLADPANVTALKTEMVEVFNQKLSLGLIDCGKELESFGDERPLLLVILANHDPGSTKLRDLLASLPPSPHADLRFATASFMGYGLFDQGIHDLDTLHKRFGDYVHSSGRGREPKRLMTAPVLTVHRSAEEIGGNCIEIACGEHRILLDAGSPLDTEAFADAPCPDTSRPVDAVLISHPHQDHYGLLPGLPTDWPVWCGAPTETLMRLTSAVTGKSIPQVVHNFRSSEPITIGPFTITPLLTDHFAFDSHMLLDAHLGRFANVRRLGDGEGVLVG